MNLFLSVLLYLCSFGSNIYIYIWQTQLAGKLKPPANSTCRPTQLAGKFNLQTNSTQTQTQLTKNSPCQETQFIGKLIGLANSTPRQTQIPAKLSSPTNTFDRKTHFIADINSPWKSAELNSSLSSTHRQTQLASKFELP